MRDGSDFRNQICAHWGRQFDVAHTLTADLLQRDFDTAFLADNAAIFHALIFAAQAFVIFDRAKDTRAEQAITLGLERPVVDGFRLLDLTERPREDPLGRCQRDLDFVKGFWPVRRGLNGLFVSSWFIFKSLNLGGRLVRMGRGTEGRQRARLLILLRIQEFHVQAEAADFFHKHVEAFGIRPLRSCLRL